MPVDKAYVDENSDGINKVSKSGDTMSGNLNMDGNIYWFTCRLTIIRI